MSDIENPREYWDRVAWGKDFTIQPALERFGQLVDRRTRILDYGCGYGRVTAKLAALGYASVLGLDPSPEMIKRGQKNHPGLDLRVASGLPLPFAGGAFGAAVMLAVLTCLTRDDEQRQVLAQLNKVLEPGGVIYLADFLLNRDERNLARYEKYAPRYGRYGVFHLDEGVVLRHHDPAWIEQITAPFERLAYWEDTSATMNGHQSRIFHYFGRKPSQAQ